MTLLDRAKNLSKNTTGREMELFISDFLEAYPEKQFQNDEIIGMCGSCTGCCCENDGKDRTKPQIIKVSDQFAVAGRSTCWKPTVVKKVDLMTTGREWEPCYGEIPYGFLKAIRDSIV